MSESDKWDGAGSQLGFLIDRLSALSANDPRLSVIEAVLDGDYISVWQRAMALSPTSPDDYPSVKKMRGILNENCGADELTAGETGGVK